MNDQDQFEIMPVLLTVKDMPSFQFVLNANTRDITGAWTQTGKYIDRKDFSKEVEGIAKEKEKEWR